LKESSPHSEGSGVLMTPDMPMEMSERCCWKAEMISSEALEME
jgi:hypothetical protein